MLLALLPVSFIGCRQNHSILGRVHHLQGSEKGTDYSPKSRFDLVEFEDRLFSWSQDPRFPERRYVPPSELSFNEIKALSNFAYRAPQQLCGFMPSDVRGSQLALYCGHRAGRHVRSMCR